MKDTDKIEELENRIKELENELEGAVVFIKEISPMITDSLKEEIKKVDAEDVAECATVLAVFASLISDENCHSLFKGAYETIEAMKAQNGGSAK